MTDKEKEVRDRCRNICNRNDKEKAIELIKEEYPHCAIDVAMHYGQGGLKMSMGSILWKDMSISF